MVTSPGVWKKSSLTAKGFAGTAAEPALEPAGGVAVVVAMTLGAGPDAGATGCAAAAPADAATGSAVMTGAVVGVTTDGKGTG